MKNKILERIPEWIAIALLILAGVAGLLVSTLDFLGNDYTNGPWKWLKGPQSLTLLIAGLLALSLGLERLIFFRRLEERLDEMEAKISGEFDTKRLRKLFDENLVKVFGKRVSHLLKQIETARLEKTITLEGKDDIGYWFPIFYLETLRAFPKSTFLATSYPSQNFFWKHEHVMEEIKKFTEQGKMERIFFLTRESDLSREEVKRILQKQLECGVTVYITDVSKFPDHLKSKASETTLVNSEESIGWHAEIRDRKILKVRATADKDKIRKYKETLDEIKKLNCTKLYIPPNI